MSRELSSSSWMLDVRRRHGSKKLFSSCVDDVWRFPNWFWDVLALARFSLTYYPLMFWDLNNWWDMWVLSMLCIIISWFFTAPMFTPLTSPKPIQNCHNFWVYIPIAISEKQIDLPQTNTTPPEEGSKPAVPFQTKKERTEVLVKQLLKVSMENNTLEAEILAKVQRGVSGDGFDEVFPWEWTGFGGKNTWGPVVIQKTKKFQFFGAARGNLFRKEPSITTDSRYLWVSFLLLSYDYTMRRCFHHSHHNYFHTATRTFFHWPWWRSKTVANASPYHCSSLTKPCQKLQAGTGFLKGWSSLQWVPQRELRNSQSCYMESFSSWWF